MDREQMRALVSEWTSRLSTLELIGRLEDLSDLDLLEIVLVIEMLEETEALQPDAER